jgi:hypothetical protein
MNRKLGFLYLALAFLPLSAMAERRGDQGLGLMLGNPSGLSYKFWLDEKTAFDAAAGINQDEFDVHATFLWHVFNWNDRIQPGSLGAITERGDFPVYFGVGPRVLFEKNTEFGLRFPVGLSFLPRSSTWEFFTEIAPVVRLTPDTGMDFDFAIGARYYFPAIRARAAD